MVEEFVHSQEGTAGRSDDITALPYLTTEDLASQEELIITRKLTLFLNFYFQILAVRTKVCFHWVEENNGLLYAAV